MKGIRKLFLGLVLLTLFGVGFKIEAKADITLGFETPDWSKADGTTGSGLRANIESDAIGDFPTAPTNGKFAVSVITGKSSGSFTISRGTNNIKTWNGRIYLITKNTGSGNNYWIAIGDGEPIPYTPGSSDPLPIDGLVATKAAVKGEIKAHGTASDDKKTARFKVEGNKPEIVTDGTTLPASIRNMSGFDFETGTGGASLDPASDDPEITIFEVSGAYTPTGITVTISFPDDEQWFLPGETATINVSKTPENKTANGTDTVHKYNEWTVEAGLEKVPDSDTYNTIQVKVKDGTNNHKATIDYNPVSLSIPNSSTYKTGNTITATWAPTDDRFTQGTVKFDGTTIPATWGASNVTFTIPNKTSGTYNIEIETKEAADSANNSKFTRSVEVEQSQFAIYEPIEVTYKRSITLDNFMDPKDRTQVVTVSSLRPGTITVSTDGTAAPANTVILSGKAVQTTEKDYLTVNDVPIGVIVYKLPEISKVSGSGDSSSLNSGSSSSSNSSTGAFKVTMPVGVYHTSKDGKTTYMYDDVTHARVEFKASGHDRKKATLKLNNSNKDEATRHETVSALTAHSIFKDICDDDSTTVTVTAYPMEGSNIDEYDPEVSDETELTVYKIKLDGSAGAKYTINGSDIGDTLYAVKGVKYTIKASPKNSGDKFDRWENNDFSTADGGTFTADGSKTFKAYFGTSSSSSSSSSSDRNRSAVNGDTNGDDYDDVPKTGESKADIWILWSVLLISILGAAFMIRKRFGLVRAIAAADEEMARAVHEEKVEAEKKEKESKMQMLKDLRKL